MHDPGPTKMTGEGAPDPTLGNLAAGESFVFNFAKVGHDVVTDFHPASDLLQLGGPIAAMVQAALNATHEDGHANSLLALEAQDPITLTGVLKAQLHASDFHIG
jgi:hypothetical protein